MKISIGAVGLMTVFVAGAVRPVLAQDFSVGYQFQRLFATGDSLNLPAGFNVDVSGSILGHLSVVGQFDWSRKTESNVILGTTLEGTSTLSTFGGGVRWTSLSNPNATPFIHLVVGATHESDTGKIAGVSFSAANASTTDAMVQVGGGVALPLTKSVSAVVQFDYRRILTKDPGTNSMRIVGGIRFKIR
ncbi:MAG TPA: outer membrane beta-barrel protein [Vicinamibacterales bacterium]|nr:outer membrane beta-barrel protein [Vicinamibacterales bacterium]